jgi:uncharacterized protein (DUF2147 family)
MAGREYSGGQNLDPAMKKLYNVHRVESQDKLKARGYIIGFSY